MELTSIIKYEGGVDSATTFVWKHPREDFNTGSQLIVHESQEAIFFLNGHMLDSFGPGRHELETQNIPLLSSIVNIPTDGESPFHAEIYFVNLCEQMGIAWGTNSKIQYIEPTYDFPLAIGASGEMALAVREPKKLLIKIVGTQAVLSQDGLIQYFKSFIQTRIKSAISKTIKRQSLSIFEIDSQLDDLSIEVKQRLEPDFADYGLELTQMLITTIVKPEGDPIYERFKALRFRRYADIAEAKINQQVDIIDQETKAQKTVIDAQARAEKRQVEGYTYQQERGFDVAEQMAQNEAAGEFANMGIGLGVMSGIGGSMGNIVGGAVSQALDGNDASATNVPFFATNSTQAAGISKFCANCGYAFCEQERFCPQCGSKRGQS